MASLTRMRRPSAKPSWPCSVRSCRTLFNRSGSVWWAMWFYCWMCLLTPQQETSVARPRPVFRAQSVITPPGFGCARLATLTFAPPHPGGVMTDGRKTIYRSSFTPAFADKVMAGEIPAHIGPEACKTLFSALSRDPQATLERDFCNKVIRTDTSAAELLGLFPDALSDCKILQEKADDLVREGLKKMLERVIAAEYEWVKRVLENCPEVLMRCPSETKEIFIERVKALDESKLDVECQHSLSGIKVMLNIENTDRLDTITAGVKSRSGEPVQ